MISSANSLPQIGPCMNPCPEKPVKSKNQQKTKIGSGINQTYMLGYPVKNICMGQARGFIKVGPVVK